MAKASTKVFVREGAWPSPPTSAGRRRTPRPRWARACCPCTATSIEADVAEAFRTAVAEFGRVDVVLNVAGIGGPALHELDMDAYDRTFDVNLAASSWA